MRFWLAMAGMAVVLGISFLFLSKERSPNVTGRDEGPEIANNEVVSEPRSKRNESPPNVDMQVSRPAAVEADEELPIELDKILAGGSSEPLIPPVLRVDIDVDMAGGKAKYNHEPLVPPVIHVNLDHALAPGEAASKEAIVPPVIHLE